MIIVKNIEKETLQKKKLGLPLETEGHNESQYLSINTLEKIPKN